MNTSRSIDSSCPHFDDAIAEIEKGRKINEQLRDALSEAEDKIESLETDLGLREEELEKANERIAELESELQERDAA